jgi:hypothetical protein
MIKVFKVQVNFYEAHLFWIVWSGGILAFDFLFIRIK